MSQLALSLFPGPVSAAPADTCLVPIPEDERPLRGDAGWVDWRLCGRISEQLSSGYVSGKSGEAALLPAGPPLGVGRVLLVGVGPREHLAGGPLLNAMRIAATKLLALQSGTALLACPGSIDFENEAVSVLRGIVSGMAEAEGGADLNLVLPNGQRFEKPLLSALADVVPGAHGWGVSVDLSWAQLDEELIAVLPR